MGFLSALNPFRDTINKAIDLADQAITDKDALNELKYSLSELKENTYQMELQTKTVPWVDGLHKMGRQIISLVSILAIVGLKLADVDLSMEEMIALAGPGGVYNYVKGKGEA
jgi:hypothetical protein